MESPDKKTELRSQVKDLRRALLPCEKAVMDEKILNHLLSLDSVRHAPCIYVYVSFGIEVDTKVLLDRLWKLGKRVAVPRVEGKEISFYYITSMEDLRPGCMGILEPVPGCEAAGSSAAPLIAPGLAFTEAGERIGYGGGFYDRFFEREPEHLRIGVAYPFQIFPELETGPCDIPVHTVIGPDGVYGA